MNAAQFPAYLQPLPQMATARESMRQGMTEARKVRRLLSRVELLHHLDAIGELAPQAPLSFLAIRVSGLDAVEAARGDVGVRLIVRAVGEAVNELCRGTDIAGELGSGVFGIILQGSGARSAAAAAARLTHHLNRLPFLPASCAALVGAATGSGDHGRRLATAALEMFEAPNAGG